jgi:micrococcal nuclease
MYNYKALVTNVVDGDTIDLEVDLGFNIKYDLRVRLYGIDTWESRTRDLDHKAKGLRATEFVNDKILGKVVEFISYKDSKGKYGRYLGNIWYRDINGVPMSLVEELRTHGFEKEI